MQPEVAVVTEPKSGRNPEKIAERLLFDSRWMLYPMAVGLVLALVVYSIKFMYEDYELIRHALSMDAEQIMVLMLGLVDMFMVANLLVMITQGSYFIFIQPFQFIEKGKKPQWLEHVDSSVLKVKISTSIAGITLIRVLKDFVNIEHTEWVLIQHRMYIHGLCLLSAIILAIIWRVLHPNGWINGHHEAK
jgi:uncharacterized protein (TIGR00645 family)